MLHYASNRTGIWEDFDIDTAGTVAILFIFTLSGPQIAVNEIGY